MSINMGIFIVEFYISCYILHKASDTSIGKLSTGYRTKSKIHIHNKCFIFRYNIHLWLFLYTGQPTELANLGCLIDLSKVEELIEQYSSWQNSILIIFNSSWYYKFSLFHHDLYESYIFPALHCNNIVVYEPHYFPQAINYLVIHPISNMFQVP